MRSVCEALAVFAEAVSHFLAGAAEDIPEVARAFALGLLLQGRLSQLPEAVLEHEGGYQHHQEACGCQHEMHRQGEDHYEQPDHEGDNRPAQQLDVLGVDRGRLDFLGEARIGLIELRLYVLKNLLLVL